MEAFMVSYEVETVRRPRPRVYHHEYYPQSGQVYVYSPRERVIDCNEAAEKYGGLLVCERNMKKPPMSSSSKPGFQAPVLVNQVTKPSPTNSVKFGVNQDTKPPLMQPRSYLAPPKYQEPSSTNPVNFVVNQDAKPQLMRVHSYLVPTNNQDSVSHLNNSFGAEADETVKRNTTKKPSISSSSKIGLQGPLLVNQVSKSSSTTINQDTKPSLMQPRSYLVPTKNQASHVNNSFGEDSDEVVNKRASKYISSVKARFRNEFNHSE